MRTPKKIVSLASCAFTGISVSTFYAWLDKGKRQKKGEFVEFLEAVTRAEAEAELRMIAQWQAHIPRDWRAARDFLARRYPERWGLKGRVGLEDSGDMTQSHETDSLTDRLIADPGFLTPIQIAADQIMKKRKRDYTNGQATVYSKQEITVFSSNGQLTALYSHKLAGIWVIHW